MVVDYESHEDNKGRIPVKLLGYTLGTATGWDRIDEDVIVFYDFDEISDVDILKVMRELAPNDFDSCDLYFNQLAGILTFDFYTELTVFHRITVPSYINITEAEASTPKDEAPDE